MYSHIIFDAIDLNQPFFCITIDDLNKKTMQTKIHLLLSLIITTLLFFSCEKKHIQDASVETINDVTLVKPQNDQEIAEAKQLLTDAQEIQSKRTPSTSTCCDVVSLFLHPYSTPSQINLSVRHRMNKPTQEIRLYNYKKKPNGSVTYMGYYSIRNSRTDCNTYQFNFAPSPDLPSGDYRSMAIILDEGHWCGGYQILPHWTMP